MKFHLEIKRVYAPANPNDGYRVLVDRLWPRGVKKDKARIDLWLAKVAPSTELRQAFHRAPARWQEFKRQYFRELDQNRQGLAAVTEMAAKGRVTLLFGAKDETHNNAAVLKDYLEHHAALARHSSISRAAPKNSA